MDDHWRLAVALVVRMEEGTWERTAWRLGYQGGAAVTSLILRTLGCRPTDLERRPAFGLGAVGRRLEALVGSQTAGEKRADRTDALRSQR